MLLRLLVCLMIVALPARALAAECLAIASNQTGPVIIPAALAEGEVRIEYLGHSTFLIESPGGVRIATHLGEAIGHTSREEIVSSLFE